jgi:hypothetical protein
VFHPGPFHSWPAHAWPFHAWSFHAPAFKTWPSDARVLKTTPLHAGAFKTWPPDARVLKPAPLHAGAFKTTPLDAGVAYHARVFHAAVEPFLPVQRDLPPQAFLVLPQVIVVHAAIAAQAASAGMEALHVVAEAVRRAVPTMTVVIIAPP